jgi:thiol-disulfide isomerase/thioredoxin
MSGDAYCDWSSDVCSSDLVIVLNFWFTQCKPCVAEFPELNELKEKYKSF